MGMLEIFFDLIHEPAEAFRRMRGERRWGLAIILPLLALFSLLLSFLILFADKEMASRFLTWGLTLLWALWILQWVGTTPLFHLSCEIMGGRGRATDLLILYPAILLPFFLLPAFSLLSLTLGIWLFLLGFVLCSLWSMALSVKVLRYNYDLENERAAGALLLPGAFLFGIGILSLLLLSAIAFSF